jgi:WD40-like Beta Propeller Repeat
VSPISPADKSKLRALAGIGVLCALLIAGYAWMTVPPPPRDATLPPVATSTDLERAVRPAPVAPDVAPVAPAAPAVEPPARSPVSRPPILVRHTAIDMSYGRLAVDFGAGGPASRQVTEFSCQQVYFARNRGVCLETRVGVITTYFAILFDARFQQTAAVPLAGIPSRTRVSPDGEYAAITVFVSGHSYGGTDFSTETQIIDTVSGKPVVANLEQMQVWSAEGQRMAASDFNFWGVTFAADRNRFYASLGTGGVVYLVEGDVRANRMTVRRTGVECPSLSPDGTRLAFKKRVPGGGLPKWRLYVLDLATLTESAVAETRFIDEQVEWLDDTQILYTQADRDGVSPAITDVWAVPADGSGKPALFLREAASPTVLRGSATAGQ